MPVRMDGNLGKGSAPVGVRGRNYATAQAASRFSLANLNADPVLKCQLGGSAVTLSNIEVEPEI
ncbi:hypothetical protein GCM10022212_01090 [Actimicrobium antarcticum]|uniref:Uncharacterized protein n=1 Tax=Actimicrobium antarcticum TaxID=1051899 RepID=A0ABP7SH01_9BURK